MEDRNRNINREQEEILDRELEMLMEAMPEQDDFEKKIDKYIKKKIQKITVRTVVSIFCGIIILFLLISPAMNAAYLNPAKLQKDETFCSVLRDYYETTKPYIEVCSVDVKKKGFAKYELAIEANNHFNTHFFGRNNVWVEISRGKYKNWRDSEMLLETAYLGRFESPVSKSDEKHLIEELGKLPESAEISLEIGDKEVRNVEDLLKEDVQLDWIEVYHPNQPEFQGGLSLWRNRQREESDDREEMTAQELLDVYVKQLKNLVEHSKIWEPLQLPYHSVVFAGGSEQMKECYEDAKTLTKLQTKGYYISGTRDEILTYLQKTSVESVSVYDVKSSIWDA